MARLALAAVLALLAGAAPVLAADQAVGTSGSSFVPGAVEVAPGDTVTWTNPSQGFHNVHFDDGQFDMPAQPSGTWPPDVSRTFSTPGTYTYYCEAHRDSGMTGTVTVEASPVTYTWEGGNAAWTDPANWSPDGLPGPGDVAVVDTPSTVFLGVDTSVGRLDLSGGASLDLTAVLTVLEGGTWTGARLDRGWLVIGPGANVTATSFNLTSDEDDTARLENQGSLAMAGHFNSQSLTGAELKNSGTITVAGDGAFLRPRLSNSGTIAVNGGVFRLYRGTGVDNTGSLTVASGATLHVVGSTATIGPGGQVGGAGAVLVESTLRTLAGSTISAHGLTVENGGRLELGGAGSVGALQMVSSSSRGGDGTLTVTSDLTVLAPVRFDDAGTTIVQPFESFSGGVITVAEQAVLRFAGGVTRTGGAFQLGENVAGATPVLEVGGAMNVNGVLGDPVAKVRLLPTGLLTVPAGTTLPIAPPFESLGMVHVDGALAGDVTVMAGTLSGSGTIAGGLSVGGGTVTPGGSPGTLTVEGALSLAGGTLAIDLLGATSFDRVVAESATLGGTLSIHAGFTPAVTDTFRFIETGAEPAGAFASIAGAAMKVKRDAAGAVLFSEPPPPPPDAIAAPVPTPVSEPPVSTSTRPRFGTLVKLPRCAARRSVKVRLVAPAASARVKLGRKLLETVRVGKPVTLKRLPKRAFTLAIEVRLADGRMVKGAKRFKPCRQRGAS